MRAVDGLHMIDMAHDGAIAFYLLVGSVLTLVIGLLALALFNRAVRRNMQVAAERPLPSLPSTQERRLPAPGPVIFRTDAATAPSRGGGRSGRLLMRVALAHAFSGAAFGLTASMLLLTFSGIALFPLRTAAVVWALAWPTVLVLSLVVGPDRAMQGGVAMAYLAGIGLLCLGAFFLDVQPMGPSGSDSGFILPGFLTPVLVWAIYAIPSLFLVLFLNRAIRTIGPLVLVFVFVCLLGSHLTLMALAQEAVMRMAATVAFETGLGAASVFFLVAAAGFLLGGGPAWWCVAFLRDRYAAKRLSDLTLAAGAIWLMQSLVLAYSLFREQGPVGALAAALPFAVWALTLNLIQRPTAVAARSKPAQHLLLLRVFGFGHRSLRLLDLLGAHWRPIGSINLIAAPDLAARTVEPSTFLLFLRGCLGDLFLSRRGDVARRIQEADTSPDPDGRFRFNQFFCSGEVWKDAVTRLMAGSALVLMDLRGFGPTRHGCVFELQTLLDTVPLAKLVLLVDGTTDRHALENLVRDRWGELAVGSPNLSPASGGLLLLDTSQSEIRSVRRLLAVVGDPGRPALPRSVASETSPPTRGLT